MSKKVYFVDDPDVGYFEMYESIEEVLQSASNWELGTFPCNIYEATFIGELNNKTVLERIDDI